MFSGRRGAKDSCNVFFLCERANNNTCRQSIRVDSSAICSVVHRWPASGFQWGSIIRCADRPTARSLICSTLILLNPAHELGEMRRHNGRYPPPPRTRRYCELHASMDTRDRGSTFLLHLMVLTAGRRKEAILADWHRAVYIKPAGQCQSSRERTTGLSRCSTIADS
jgi:hypothetical protein